ncbi:D-alanine--D-alanine ligase [Bordetella ansorpii]|uniref:D-alanine--D-alanine ligase n=1 Tax=Bordetella ansorpii TaxID=288768 RepID=A0A157SWR1_9BORD|nr:non-ribosomal peptide synthetase [Bordetella ansorpii]SAI74503.1 D-alanine--D-alanine ligase [Bordetella ansorpii]
MKSMNGDTGVTDSIVARLCEHAAHRPDDTALVVVGSDGGPEADLRISYEALHSRARSLAAGLRECGRLGDRVLLMLDNDDHYVVGFLACLYAGLVAVPAYPPQASRPQLAARVVAIARACDPACVLTSDACLDDVRQALAGVVRVPILTAGSAVSTAMQACRLPGADDIAFLQYTSGSTSQPKGVIVTHGNLMANEAAIEASLSVGADDVFVSWLPLYHDMGLIGGLLQPLYRGIPVVLMSPRFFFERPVRWLQAISRYRGTISGGPDFSYRLCTERIVPGDSGLDLSSWRVAFCGAEPVRHDTLEAFAGAFQPAGFDAGALYPCYGLAEATLLVTGGRRGAGLRATRCDPEALAGGLARERADGHPQVSCGFAAPLHRLAVIDPATGVAVPEGRVGEIRVQGGSISRGYWNDPQASAETFVAGEGGHWLRTGDLGFLKDGELYVTGRLKDLIIVRGQNLYPQDIERAVEERVEAVRKGRVAAFACPRDDGSEAIGIAAEIGRGTQKRATAQQIGAAVSAAVAEACAEVPGVVVLLNPGGLPKTSSGKLQRRACEAALRDGTLDAWSVLRDQDAAAGGPMDEAALQWDSDPLAVGMKAIWAQVLKRPWDALAGDPDFFALGGSSMAAVQLAARIGACWAVDYPVRLVYEHPRLSQAVGQVRARQANPQAAAQPVPRLAPEVREGLLPLSHAQQRLWFLWHMDPASTAYHISCALHLKGRLDVAAVRAALEGLVARHEALRTVYLTDAAGAVCQRVLPRAMTQISVVDLASLPVQARAARRERALYDTHQAPFDLAAGPMMRACVIDEGEGCHVLALTVHHIAADGWSMQVLCDDFARGYTARVRGTQDAAPPSTLQYADYAVWQRDRLAQGEAQRQLAWWRARLGQEHPVLELPTDRPRRAGALQGTAAVHAFALAGRDAQALQRAARHASSSTFMVLLAAFQALLFRYTGQSDIRVGTTNNNRAQPEVAGIVGFFVNLQVLRADIDGRMALAEVLRQARETVLGAQAHADLPFEMLVEALQPGRDPDHSPLFRVLMNHQALDDGRLRALPGLALQELAHGDQAARFELALDTMEHGPGDIRMRLTYAPGLFDAGTIERLAAYYLCMLRAFAEQADARVEDVALQEPIRLIEAPPQAAADAAPLPDAEPLLHRRIEQWAARDGQAPALSGGGVALTRGQLNARANRVAHALRAQGVGAQDRVGLMMPRGPDLVVALLGILKAGAAYVPLDPAYPADRLAYMAADGGLAGLVVDGSHEAAAADLAPGRAVWTLSSLAEAADDDGDLALDLPAQALAYVIYTSGSTGQPKGVGVTHHNVARLLDATRGGMRLGENDVWTLFHSYAFDFSVWEIFGALCLGGQLVSVDHAISRSPEDFAVLLRDHAVTVLNQTPSAFRSLIQTPLAQAGALQSLRLVVFGGEALDVASLRPWVERYGDQRPALVNMYGITETTVHVTHRRILRADVDGGRSPIGHAIGDLRLHVLDTALRAAPVDIAGELYVSGPGVARGYLNRPGLTAQRFLADPFAGDGARLYRTGDMARRRADGETEYLGRIDQQLKLRGFRIEPGEIETLLRACPGVADAAVSLRSGPDGQGRLVAYVVPAAGLSGLAQDEAPSQALVSQWETVFDGTYENTDVAPSFRGWNSSYTDAPIPEAEMRRWLDDTVARIRALDGRRILELGCGVGLLVQHLAAGAERYVGTDLSPRAVADLRQWLATRPGLAHVQLTQAQATDVPAGPHDVMVLNSVAQYFPGLAYLDEVLRNASATLAPGGRMFIGDLRHPAHLPLFHATVLLHKADPDTPLRQLRLRVERAVEREKELAVDPAYFHEAAARLGLGAARVMLKHGGDDNELTRYRYDVALGPADALGQARDARVVRWDTLAAGAADVEALLSQQPQAPLRVTGVPNARLSRDAAVWRALQDASRAEITAGTLRAQILDIETAGIEPDALRGLAEKLGYEACAEWRDADPLGGYDIEFARPGAPRAAMAPPPRDGRVLASDPLRAQRLAVLPARMRARLAERLPEYMVPGHYALVDALPRTPSGKLDYRGLPEPEVAGRPPASESPRGAVEQALAQVWSQALGLDSVGRDDNFFEIGGHSLLAIRVKAVVAERYGCEIPIRSFFDHQTLREMAATLDPAPFDAPDAKARRLSELASLLDELEG